ncbi:ABC transporter substrate-binding protein [Desulfosporosinus sp. FKA]|uniref:ABC transporter substrate-binding protein n=1 Tax=Desulfosporosinus sp. FKA TaxID=1969834 RepID=UPI000B4A316E|nr:ABC transporter substrate-binding protein [Desulfosporosinus sp. FKA]
MIKRNGVFKFCAMVLIGMLTISMTACSAQKAPASSSDINSNAKPQYGGTLTVADQVAPPHLDSDKSTEWKVTEIDNHIYEGLFEFNDKFEAVPQLADSYEKLDGGKTYKVKLRKGVLFQNGKEMTSSDVEASFNRWLKNNGAGDIIKPYFDKVEVIGPYEMDFKFKEPYAPFVNILASEVSGQKFYVRTKEMVDKFGDNIITEHIGTGPYQVAEYVPDQYVKLKRFDKYVPNPRPSSLFSGKRVAYLDEIVFKFVPDEEVRVAGVETGEFQYADEVSQDKYEMLKSNPNVQPIIVPYDMMGMVVFNCGKAPFNNLDARKAVNAALDMAEYGKAAVGDEKFWRLDGSLFPKGSIWYDGNAGKGIYNQPNLEEAKALLKKSGYDGTPIVILNTKENAVESQGALSLKSQLEKVGFRVDVQLYDRATMLQKRSQVNNWNISISNWVEFNPDPQVFGAWIGTKKWIGNWQDDDSAHMDAIFNKMLGETDTNTRIQDVKDMYKEFWDKVPMIKTVNYSRLHVKNKSLQGYPDFCKQIFWNTWLQK